MSQTRVRCKLDAYTACLKKRNSLVEKSAHDENIEREVSLYREVTLHVTQRCSGKNVVLFLREMTVSSEKQVYGVTMKGMIAKSFKLVQSVSRVSFLMNPFPFSHNHLGVLQSYLYLVLAVVALFLGLGISTASILTS